MLKLSPRKSRMHGRLFLIELMFACNYTIGYRIGPGTPSPLACANTSDPRRVSKAWNQGGLDRRHAGAMQLAFNRDLVLKIAGVRPLTTSPQSLVPELKGFTGARALPLAGLDRIGDYTY